MYNSKQIRLTRRFMLSATGAMLGVSLTGRAAFAEGGRDPQVPTEDISNDPPPKKRPNQKTRVMLTQKNYHRVSPKGLKRAIAGNKAGDEYRIIGFSKKMSQNIFEMTLLNRKKTLAIFKKMRTLKTKKAREQYLFGQEIGLDSKIREIDKDIEPKTMGDILFNDDKEYVKELKAERKKLKAYLRLLRKWGAKPMEGRLNSLEGGSLTQFFLGIPITSTSRVSTN